MLTKVAPQVRRLPFRISRAMFSSKDESSSSGSIREAGGSFAKREKAQEDQYFRKLQQQQLKEMKSHLQDQIKHHENEIKRHQEILDKMKKTHEKLSKE